jgi:hypothetical protein
MEYPVLRSPESKSSIEPRGDAQRVFYQCGRFARLKMDIRKS